MPYPTQDAIKEDAIFRGPDVDSEFHHGDLEGSFQESDGILEGTFDVGGQEHFYMETQMCVVRPGEDDEMTVHASAQAITNVQVRFTFMPPISKGGSGSMSFSHC